MRKLKPITQVENAIKHLQKANQYKHDAGRGHFTSPSSELDQNKIIDHAKTRLANLIEQFTAPVDYSIPEKERPEVIRGY